THPTMDVQRQLREAPFFSILNDNDSPSFAIRSRISPPDPDKASSAALNPTSESTSPCPRPAKQARPDLIRQNHYSRSSSLSSAGSPPLLRFSSNSSMDSSPSPITPTYMYNDNNLPSFDPLTRQDLVGYLPSPTTITPFLDQQLMLATPMMPDHFSAKHCPPTLHTAQYPTVPASINPGFHHIPTPTSSSSSVPPPAAGPADAASCTPPVKIQSKTSPTTSSGPTPGKKNKYPCPYAQAHSCTATFTTSGHAARHGKKHTGEKGVHCPICNKAFTRKDNMKQHERTHKGSNAEPSGQNSASRRSKASVTKAAQRARQAQKDDTMHPDRSRRSSLIHSPLSEITSLAPPTTETSMSTESSLATNFYPEAPQLLMPIQTIPETLSPNTIYPPLNEDLLNQQGPLLPLPQRGLDKSEEFLMNGGLQMPSLVRGFSDLDTLAQVAESFDPYYAVPQ
ncbi:uncharacterized protein A1O9_11203, partial [Exophiala aquamarina CBS 119918]